MLQRVWRRGWSVIGVNWLGAAPGNKPWGAVQIIHTLALVWGQAATVPVSRLLAKWRLKGGIGTVLNGVDLEGALHRLLPV